MRDAAAAEADQPDRHDRQRVRDLLRQPSNSGAFDTSQRSAQVFTETFPVIDFNPPSAAQVGCSNSTGINEGSRPLTNVIPNPDGTCSTSSIEFLVQSL
jgi:hypothetical protein